MLYRTKLIKISYKGTVSVLVCLALRPKVGFESGRNTDMAEVVIVAAARTPIGKFNGSLAAATTAQLGAAAIRGALTKCKLPAAAVQQCWMGNVVSADVGQVRGTELQIDAACADIIGCYVRWQNRAVSCPLQPSEGTSQTSSAGRRPRRIKLLHYNQQGLLVWHEGDRAGCSADHASSSAHCRCRWDGVDVERSFLRAKGTSHYK